MIGKFDAVTQFATDYKNHFERRDVRVDKKLVKMAIPKVRIKLRLQDGTEKEFKWVKMDQSTWASQLGTSIYGYYFTVDSEFLGAIYEYAMQYMMIIKGLLGELLGTFGNYVKEISLSIHVN
jgi:hypothetical protein